MSNLARGKKEEVVELLQRTIMLDGNVLGEIAYLGYSAEADGTVVRFLLDTYFVHTRPMSDVIGKGKMFEIEFVAVEKEKGFRRLFILKEFLHKKTRVFSSVNSVVVTAPKAFLDSTVRKMVKEMKRKVKELPIEEPAF